MRRRRIKTIGCRAGKFTCHTLRSTIPQDAIYAAHRGSRGIGADTCKEVENSAIRWLPAQTEESTSIAAAPDQWSMSLPHSSSEIAISEIIPRLICNCNYQAHSRSSTYLLRSNALVSPKRKSLDSRACTAQFWRRLSVWPLLAWSHQLGQVVARSLRLKLRKQQNKREKKL